MMRSALFLFGTFVVLLPTAALVFAGWNGASGEWLSHLWHTVLPSHASVSARIALGAALLSALLGLVPAWITHHHAIPMRRFLTLLAILPLTFPAFVLAGIYDEAFPGSWIGSEGKLVLSLASAASPYVFLLVRIALARIPASFREAALALGCNARARILRLHLPLLTIPLCASTFLAISDALSDYGAAERLGVGTLSIGLHNLWVGLLRNDVAALLSCLLLGFSFVLALPWMLALLRSSSQNSTATPAFRRRPCTRPAGWLLLAACLATSFPSFFVPLACTGSWAIQKLSRVRLETLYGDLVSSLLTAGSVVVVLAAVATALLLVARPGRQMGWGERALWLSLVNYLLPPLVLAFVFLSFSSEGSPWAGGLAPLHDSRILLVAAAALRFLPLMLLPLLDALARTSPHLVESARSLGFGPIRARLSVLVPSLWPALVVGSALVFLETMKELTLSLSLQPFGYSALSLRVFSYTNLHLAREASVWVVAMQTAMLYPVLKLWSFIDKEEQKDA